LITTSFPIILVFKSFFANGIVIKFQYVRIAIHIYIILKKLCSRQYSIQKSLILTFYSLSAKVQIRVWDRHSDFKILYRVYINDQSLVCEIEKIHTMTYNIRNSTLYTTPTLI
jgi:hypothetical protein